jgi:hypothetical protein
VDELLTIGEFSQACGLSARMLRSYAGTGLLPPVAVDRWTGYRYYAPDQACAAPLASALSVRAALGLAGVALAASMLSPLQASSIRSFEQSIE